MKHVLISISLLAYFSLSGENKNFFFIKNNSAQNLFIVTIDGFRWQEIFTGADSLLLFNPVYAQNEAALNCRQYWSTDLHERRKRLMPFLWNTIGTKGQLYGNRLEGNRMNTANIFALSYPGYNELLTGTTDPAIFNNDKKLNPNINLMEYVERQDSFRNKVAAFTSWNMFTYILNQPRNGLPVNNDRSVPVRSDRQSFEEAKSYLAKNQPRLFFLALGETDEFAHARRYDRYLQKAAEADSIIRSIWQWIQETPCYRNKTTLVITTDHGRGASGKKWFDHGMLIKGSSQTWMACIGPGIEPLGEVREKMQLYTKQLPAVMAALLGLRFKKEPPPGW